MEPEKNSARIYLPIPQPEEITALEKEDGMGAYLMMFASWGAGLPLPLINIIASVIYFYFNKSKSKFVHFHSLQGLLSGIPVSILNATVIIWVIYSLYHEFYSQAFWGFIVMSVVINIVYLVFGMIACIKAKRGHFYYFPFFGRLSFHLVYRINNHQQVEFVNKAPTA